MDRNLRRYRIVAINERSDKKTTVSAYPLTRDEACVNLSKFSYHPARRVQLEEIETATLERPTETSISHT